LRIPCPIAPGFHIPPFGAPAIAPFFSPGLSGEAVGEIQQLRAGLSGRQLMAHG